MYNMMRFSKTHVRQNSGNNCNEYYVYSAMHIWGIRTFQSKLKLKS